MFRRHLSGRLGLTLLAAGSLLCCSTLLSGRVASSWLAQATADDGSEPANAVAAGSAVTSAAAPVSSAASSSRAAFASAAVTAIAAAQQDDQPALRAFMRQKLDASNKILEGLVTDQLQMVEEGADTLLQMSREEKWRASNDMLYRRYSTEFIDAVSDMRNKAKAQSIDGTSLAWINSTMTCLKCHEWVRNTIVAGKSTPALSKQDDSQPLQGLQKTAAP